MGLTEIYRKSEEVIREKDLLRSFDAVESGFIPGHDRKILDRYTFRQRCIDAVPAVTSCRVLDVDLTTPLIMSAMTNPIPALAPDGLLQVARGLKQAGSLMWLGTPLPKDKDLDQIEGTGVPVAINIKPYADRKRMFAEIDRLQVHDIRWIGIEIDAGMGTKVQDRLIASNCLPLSCQELGEIRRAVDRPLLLKGVLSSEDARRAIEIGADGIVVSNHGAHTLDYLPHPLQVLEEILEVTGEDITIITEGGFRRGSDVLKALAFGAQVVGLGRPILQGLAVAGQEGVKSVMEEIGKELQRIMTMVGIPALDRISGEILIRD